MSGDVQPRKRKNDKKRRRDDEETRPTGVHATKMGPDDIQLHVHSDHETGGHWCAKIFFFSLLAVLLGLIGLILLENRGLADLDTPLSESRFADMLEGWVDEEREVHDEHDVHVPDSHDDEENEGAHGDDHDEDHDDQHDHDDDEPVANSQENEDEDEVEELEKDDDNDNEVDEGYDESTELGNEVTADEDDDDDDDERLRSMPKNQKLTNDAVNDVDINNRDTNTNSQSHDIKKRSTDDSDSQQSKEPQEIPIGQVTARQLEQQVNQLVENYNKLAKSLNRPILHENEAKPYPPKVDENDEEAEPELDEDDENENLAEDEGDQDEDDEDEGIEEPDNDDEDDGQDEATETVGAEETKANVDDDDNEIEPSDDQTAADDAEEESSSHNDEPKPTTSDTEKAPEEETAEFFEMKRRFTLVTAEEPIPLSAEDLQQHLNILETIPPIDESIKTIEIQTEIESTQQQQKQQQQQEPEQPQSPPVEIEYSSEDDIASPELAFQDDSEPKAYDLDEELLSEEEEEEEISSEGHDYDSESSVDDSDLLKRLDEKYGRLPQRDEPDDEDGAPEYDHDDEDIDPTWTKIDRSGPAAATTEDQILEDEIRRANEQLAENPQIALTLFEQIRQTHPTSSAAQYGLARSLDHMAELNRSNQFLKRAIHEYKEYLELGSKLNDTEFKTAAERCIDRMRFIGHHLEAVPVHKKLIERFDDDPYYRNQLAVTYLLVNKLTDAKYVLHVTLQRWRDDGFAAAHYGFVLKNLDQNFEHAAMFLRQGIESGANGTSDGRFYFNLGDALIRLGRNDEANKVFQEAAAKKLFPSQYQRSLYNVDHLKARPFWTLAESGYKHEFRNLEQNWEKIRDEGLNILSKDGYFTDEAESLRDTGVWKQFELFARGKRNTENCERTPFTCKLIETFPAARFCKRGQIKFSVMHPNTHVWPHCGPTNCRLRAHLGLKLADKTSIRVATEIRTWTEGKILVFDDSFEHEVWHNGTTYRLILIVDVWHPDLTADEKKTLVPI